MSSWLEIGEGWEMDKCGTLGEVGRWEADKYDMVGTVEEVDPPGMSRCSGKGERLMQFQNLGRPLHVASHRI